MRTKYVTVIFIVLFSLLFLGACKKSDSASGKTFVKLDKTLTGIAFSNTLTENDTLNYFTYPYIYMGGGVAAGDINNDGLTDLFFTGNMVSNALYLNQGDLTFKDITTDAGVAGDRRWFTGVTMADVNADGYLDIYCSVAGKYGPKNNLLYINNGDNTFTEKAAEYGIDDPGNSVQATFFDYDLDGDLDLYVANYPPTRFSAPNEYYRFKMEQVTDVETDKLYRNDGNRFTEVTNAAGVRSFGLSLSATVGDLNEDGWPDLYISNDFSSPDYMYLNNQDGTFKEVVKQATKHTSFYGMGVDIADYNNDGLLDIIQVDMDAKNNRRAKANMASMNPAVFWSTVASGFHYQYMHNTLQLNSGVFREDTPDFSNVSRLAGVSSTDWSWGPLFADLDNDGWKDLFISNGTRREINNRDYFINLAKDRNKRDSLLQKALAIPSEKIDNFVFKNKGDFTFERVNKAWGITHKGFSNGCVYADLDNDGDLEIITNNIDDNASVFKNTNASGNHHITITLKGPEKNPFGLGARVYVTVGETTQMQELTLSRGFQSSVAPKLHFGLGKANRIDALKVIWPDAGQELRKNVDADQQLRFDHANALPAESQPPAEKKTLFSTVAPDTFGLAYKHTENTYDDFKKEILLPHKTSTFGPGMAVGDLNGDGLEDLYIGGAAEHPGGLYLQTQEGFVKQTAEVIEKDYRYEDLGALIFDADNDGDNDLYVVSGGNEFNKESEWLQDRLYINQGDGTLQRAVNALPQMITSGSRVHAADYDNDGDLDLFIGGRLIPANYPLPADSYLLENRSENGIPGFVDVSSEKIPELKQLGMVTDARWTDYDNDGWTDLIVVGEWMPIKIFKNETGTFTDVSQKSGVEDTTGWWFSIKEGDFDADGDMDFIVGNLGLNYKYQAREEETFDIYFYDFDSNRTNDIVLSYFNDGEKFPVRGRECSSQQMPGIKGKFKDYESFSNATLEDIYTDAYLDNALHYQVKSFSSIYLENTGNGFKKHALPIEAQFTSINQIVVRDFDADGNLDALLAGNLYGSEVETPRADAGIGLLLKGNGDGTFLPVKARKSGFYAPGDVKDMALLQTPNATYVVCAKNNDALQLVRWNTSAR